MARQDRVEDGSPVLGTVPGPVGVSGSPTRCSLLAQPPLAEQSDLRKISPTRRCDRNCRQYTCRYRMITHALAIQHVGHGRPSARNRPDSSPNTRSIVVSDAHHRARKSPPARSSPRCHLRHVAPAASEHAASTSARPRCRTGTTCLSDVEAMTAQEEIFGPGGGASDSTMLRALDELAERLGGDGLPGRRLARATGNRPP